jgi:hypothetical protein
MKQLSIVLLLMVGLSCSNDAEMKDPSEVDPPSEAITDSMSLRNDSVISPDTTPGNGSQVGASDSIQKAKQ